MCAGAILQSRLDRLVIAAPNALMGAAGTRLNLFGTAASARDAPAAVQPCGCADATCTGRVSETRDSGHRGRLTPAAPGALLRTIAAPGLLPVCPPGAGVAAGGGTPTGDLWAAASESFPDAEGTRARQDGERREVSRLMRGGGGGPRPAFNAAVGWQKADSAATPCGALAASRRPSRGLWGAEALQLRTPAWGALLSTPDPSATSPAPAQHRVWAALPSRQSDARAAATEMSAASALRGGAVWCGPGSTGQPQQDAPLRSPIGDMRPFTTGSSSCGLQTSLDSEESGSDVEGGVSPACALDAEGAATPPSTALHPVGAQTEVLHGVLRDESAALLRGFFRRRRAGQRITIAARRAWDAGVRV